MPPIRVLLVDDEEELISTLVERLQLRGFEPVGVLTGEDALREVRTRQFDVVVLDLKMPGIGGVDVIKKIRELAPTLPVILLTGHLAQDESETGFREGAIDCLIKPINIEDLIVKMKEAIATHQKKAQSP